MGDAWIYERYMRMAGTPPACDSFFTVGPVVSLVPPVVSLRSTTGYRLESLRLAKMGDEWIDERRMDSRAGDG
jgi:hypothetical protein